jgi:hypothetical protein
MSLKHCHASPLVNFQIHSNIVAVLTGVSIKRTLPHFSQFHVGGFSWLLNSTLAPGWHVFAGIFTVTFTCRPDSFVTLFRDLISRYFIVAPPKELYCNIGEQKAKLVAVGQASV